VASWALAGIGVAGVAGASELAYADTLRPAPAEAPAAEPVTEDPGPSPVVYAPPVPEVVPPTDAPPPQPPEPASADTPEPVTQAPVETNTPRYTPAPQYTPKTVVQQAPVQQTQAPASQPAFPIRTSHTSVGSSSPNFTPHVTRSRGS
jgi:hypothetical protein